MARARVRLGLRYAAERYGDKAGPWLSSLRILTWAMKASMLPSSHASERSPVHEGHPRIGVWRPLGPQARGGAYAPARAAPGPRAHSRRRRQPGGHLSALEHRQSGTQAALHARL